MSPSSQRGFKRFPCVKSLSLTVGNCTLISLSVLSRSQSSMCYSISKHTACKYTIATSWINGSRQPPTCENVAKSELHGDFTHTGSDLPVCAAEMWTNDFLLTLVHLLIPLTPDDHFIIADSSQFELTLCKQTPKRIFLLTWFIFEPSAFIPVAGVGVIIKSKPSLLMYPGHIESSPVKWQHIYQNDTVKSFAFMTPWRCRYAV